jgi:hypothetical protein
MAKLFEHLLPKVMEYESGNMTDREDIVEFFQELVNSGVAWKLQGHYGRIAQSMLETGEVVMPKPGYVYKMPSQQAKSDYPEDTPERSAELEDVMSKIKLFEKKEGSK